MIHLSSYFRGHRGGVTSLVKALSDDAFYSAGSEGLIVHWQLHKPNEGNVITKLSGYLAAIAFDATKQLIYALVNHKGLYYINALSGAIENFIDLPASSFNHLILSNNSILLNSNNGELLVIEKESGAIKNRIDTGLAGYSAFAIDNEKVWYSTSKGIIKADLAVPNNETDLISFNKKVNAINLVQNKLVILTEDGVYIGDIAKNTSSLDIIKEGDFGAYLCCSNEQKSYFIILSQSNILAQFGVHKNGISLVEEIEIEHNGKINDILWFENHKFVITAGADKNIGVWQVN